MEYKRFLKSTIQNTNSRKEKMRIIKQENCEEGIQRFLW